MKNWQEFFELAQGNIKNKNLTYLHGIVYGFNYPGPVNYEVINVDHEMTTYHAVVYNTIKRNQLPLKDILTKSLSELKDIDLDRFSTTDPEQIKFFFRKYNHIKENEAEN